MSDLTERIADVLQLHGDTCTRANAQYLAAAVVKELHIEEGVDRWIIRKI